MHNFNQNSWISEILKNEEGAARNRLTNTNHLRDISIALSHFAFRNVPIEDIHAEGKLSHQDMLIINKYIVNAFALIIDKLINNKFDELEKFLAVTSSLFGTYWDDPGLEDIQVSEFNAVQDIFKKLINFTDSESDL